MSKPGEKETRAAGTAAEQAADAIMQKAREAGQVAEQATKQAAWSATKSVACTASPVLPSHGLLPFVMWMLPGPFTHMSCATNRCPLAKLKLVAIQTFKQQAGATVQAVEQAAQHAADQLDGHQQLPHQLPTHGFQAAAGRPAVTSFCTDDRKNMGAFALQQAGNGISATLCFDDSLLDYC